MLRLLPLLITTSLLGACASSTPEPALRYYQFTIDYAQQQTISQSREQTAHLLRLSPIKVQGTLNNRAMVLKLSEHEIYSAKSHFWADNPAQMLASSTQTQLMQSLEGVLVVRGADVYAEQLQSSFYQLDITVEQFNAGLENDAEVAGLWRLSRVDNKGKLHVLKIARFYHNEPLAQDGYEALAKAMAKAWHAMLKKMSEQVNTLVTPIELNK
ncbi:PqiC family protein [Pseudoalteromonas sp. SSDWG2]|uniref:PqiC family protein n=1 Tax=Pseudoalteromonas sp. SSDWG2 TaxID=3139391 RepID=UPI003BAC7E50